MYHSRYSPSGASHWMTCKGSKILQAKHVELFGKEIAESRSRAAADIGIRAHEIFEKLITNKPILDSEWVFLENYELDKSILKAVEEVKKIAKKAISIKTETRVHAPGDRKDMLFGTIDVIIELENCFHIFDLKTGRGQISEDSLQLRVYAALVSVGTGTRKPIAIHILQVDDNELKHRQKKYDATELHNWLYSTVFEIIDKIEEECEKVDLAPYYIFDFLTDLVNRGFFTPHSNCKWCLVKDKCPLQLDLQEVQNSLAFCDFESRKDALLKRVLTIKQLADELEEEAKRRLLNGEAIDGVELKVGSRKVLLAEAIEEVFGEDGYKKVWKSAGDLKKQDPDRFSKFTDESYSVSQTVSLRASGRMLDESKDNM